MGRLRTRRKTGELPVPERKLSAGTVPDGLFHFFLPFARCFVPIRRTKKDQL